MDPSNEKLCQRLNIDANLLEFKSKDVLEDLKLYLSSLTASTAERYIWRLYRALLEVPDFPRRMLIQYYRLYDKYTKDYKGTTILPKP